MSLGEIIKQKRKELNLTQDQVADQSSISKPYLSNIETLKTKNPPTDGVLRSLEKTLQFESGVLLKIAHRARAPQDVQEKLELLETQVMQLRGALKDLMSKNFSSQDAAAQNAMSGAGIDVAELLNRRTAEGNVQKLSTGVTVPIINKLAAGYPHNFTDLDYPPGAADEYIRCPDIHDSQSFAARIVGDSMEPAYHEGDVVIFSPNTAVRNGDDCFVRFDSEGGTTFKRFYQDDEATIRLQPLNDKYPSKIYPREQVTGLWPAVFRIERLR